ncbi:DUF599 domain-containing protein [Archaeoglobus profundus]|uniref:DUF599 domain-containing protein n=1 Tax=Archaeoglobus profundus (strain DSM 5631 / JCM 9629 / NBRC 100127 / Av18) TaxID=572546 RepID=D2RHP2_ARCPA|nr:DUF599 domain-containing protein [Archaeoglobus profundus]ADB57817.1 protein of unknown function DUF599 [Archaeoglobus profundus DSM 5631]
MVSQLDILAFLIFIACFGGYHALYLLIVEKYPKKAVKAYVRILREKSIANLLEREEYETLVQQLRDAIQVCYVFASSSLIFMGLMFNLLINIDEIARNLKITDVTAFEYKVLFVIAIQALSFIFFISSIRYYRMLSLLIATPPEEILRLLGITAEKFYAQLLDKGCTYYTLGSRGLLYSMLSFTWFLSPLAFLTLVIVVTLLLAKYRDFTRFQEV